MNCFIIGYIYIFNSKINLRLDFKQIHVDSPGCSMILRVGRVDLMALGLSCGSLCEARCCGGGGHCDSARGAPGCSLPSPTKPPRVSSILVYLQKFHSVEPRSTALRRVIYLSRLSGSCVGFDPPSPTSQRQQR